MSSNPLPGQDILFPKLWWLILQLLQLEGKCVGRGQCPRVVKIQVNVGGLGETLSIHPTVRLKWRLFYLLLGEEAFPTLEENPRCQRRRETQIHLPQMQSGIVPSNPVIS